jgi:hypothetical protein
MERVGYAGPYRPDRIPGLGPERRREADLAGYVAAREPKTIALHPLGRVFVVVRAASQRAAEEEALRLCNADPVRAGASGPCFLYAAGNRVVLPGRHEEPLAPDPATAGRPAQVAATPAVPPPAPPAQPAPAPTGPTAPTPAAVPAAPATPNLVTPNPATPNPATPNPLTPGPNPASAAPPPVPAPAVPARAAPAVPDPRAALLAEMIAAAPFVPRATAGATLASYLEERSHRAFAIAPERGVTWRWAAFASTAAAEERVLEGCQLRYGVPCILFALDDEIRRPPPGAEWPRRNMPRIAGPPAGFDPQRIPALGETTRRQPQVTGYATAPEPKAMAIHPRDRVFTQTGAASQAAADAAALAACDADAERGGRDGPCLLYARGNQVVLAQRLTAETLQRGTPPSPAAPPTPATARAAAASPATAPPAAPASRAVPWVPAGAPGDEVIAAAARVDPALADSLQRLFAAPPRPEFALALHLESRRIYRRTTLPTPADAERLALEGCQQTYGSPCVLLAVGLELRAADPTIGPRRDMERLLYAGPFRAELVPFQPAHPPPEVERYAQLADPKAMAVHPSGRVRTVGGAASSAEAEAQALAACQLGDRSLPCLLYASGNQVVLPEGRTAPNP